jgi:Fe-S cluster assembly ATP-binding protein
MADLEIRNLRVTAEDKEILKGLDLDVSRGEIHALMGPNGSGKSTLANAIMGHPALEITDGEIRFEGESITDADPDERARAGLFMAFQYPATIPGVSVANFLRMAVNAGREEPIKVKDFGQLLKRMTHVGTRSLGTDREHLTDRPDHLVRMGTPIT